MNNKAIGVADIHLRLSKNAAWEEERFLNLFKFLAVQPENTVFILGDTFDVSRPSLEEIGVFFKGIKLLNDKGKRVYIIDGNHEVLKKGVSVFDMIPQHGFRYIKNDCIKINNHLIYLVGWSSLGELNKIVAGGVSSVKNVLMTHLRCNVEPHIKEEFSVSKLAKAFDVIVAGDIHITKFKPKANFYYTGQPYSTKYKTKGLQSILRFTFPDDKEMKVDYIFTEFPNKVLMNVEVNDLPTISKSDNNLYKFRAKGSLLELENLHNFNNIIFDKVLEEQVISTDIVPKGKFNITKDLLNVLEVNDVEDECLKWGECYLNETLNNTKK